MSGSIFEIVEAALAGLGIPVAQSVYLSATGAALPDQFAAYTLVAGTPAQQADDVETLREHHVQISLWSRSGLASLPDVDALMVVAGFARGPERELAYDETTRHFGLAKDFIYLMEE